MSKVQKLIKVKDKKDKFSSWLDIWALKDICSEILQYNVTEKIIRKSYFFFLINLM